jgi:hypothetical protein
MGEIKNKKTKIKKTLKIDGGFKIKNINLK